MSHSDRSVDLSSSHSDFLAAIDVDDEYLQQFCTPNDMELELDSTDLFSLGTESSISSSAPEPKARSPPPPPLPPPPSSSLSRHDRISPTRRRPDDFSLSIQPHRQPHPLVDVGVPNQKKSPSPSSSYSSSPSRGHRRHVDHQHHDHRRAAVVVVGSRSSPVISGGVSGRRDGVDDDDVDDDDDVASDAVEVGSLASSVDSDGGNSVHGGGGVFFGGGGDGGRRVTSSAARRSAGSGSGSVAFSSSSSSSPSSSISSVLVDDTDDDGIGAVVGDGGRDRGVGLDSLILSNTSTRSQHHHHLTHTSASPSADRPRARTARHPDRQFRSSSDPVRIGRHRHQHHQLSMSSSSSAVTTTTTTTVSEIEMQLRLQLASLRREKLESLAHSGREVKRLKQELQNSNALAGSLRLQLRHYQEENLEGKKEQIRLKGLVEDLRRRLRTTTRGGGASTVVPVSVSSSQQQREGGRASSSSSSTPPSPVVGSDFVSREQVRASVRGIVDEYEHRFAKLQSDAAEQIRSRNTTMRKLVSRFIQLKSELSEATQLRKRFSVQLGAKGAEIGMLRSALEEREESLKAMKRLIETERGARAQEREKERGRSELSAKESERRRMEDRREAGEARARLEEKWVVERSRWEGELTRLERELRSERKDDGRLMDDVRQDMQECVVELEEMIGYANGKGVNGASSSTGGGAERTSLMGIRLDTSVNEASEEYNEKSLSNLRHRVTNHVGVLKARIQVLKDLIMTTVASRIGRQDDCHVQ